MSRWPTIQAPVSRVCRSAMPHRAAPSIYALSSGDVGGNRARELLGWRACFPVRAFAMVVFPAPEETEQGSCQARLRQGFNGVQRLHRMRRAHRNLLLHHCVESRCAGPDAIAADARKNRTGTPRGEGLTTRSRKRLVGRKVTFLTICPSRTTRHAARADYGVQPLPRRSVSS